MHVDLSKFKTSDWLKIGGGALFFIAGFLAWWKVDLGPFGDASANAFDYFWTGTISWLIFTAIAVLTFLAAAGIFKLPDNVPTPLVFLGAAALGTLLVIIRFFSDGTGVGALDRGIGLFLALIGAIVALVGSYLGFTESGGNLAELGKQLQSKTGSKSGGDSAATPPPPPPSAE
jgi:hypothetical protein